MTVLDKHGNGRLIPFAVLQLDMTTKVRPGCLVSEIAILFISLTLCFAQNNMPFATLNITFEYEGEALTLSLAHKELPGSHTADHIKDWVTTVSYYHHHFITATAAFHY
jgi:hypothetical protein